jgi:hypothetical protein
MESVDNFQWGTLLGGSVICFLIVGFLFGVLGVVGSFIGPLTMAKDTRFLYMSNKADVVRYGEEPAELMKKDPVLKSYRDTMFSVMGGLFAPIGMLMLGVAWFGLRRGESWALWVLGAAWLVAMPGHIMLLMPYFKIDAPIFMSLPPYWTVPTALTVPGLIMGWMALK